jgi:hypothetical protein
VKITIGESDPHYQPKVFVYDYDLMTGQFVKSVDEIDLAGELEADLLHVFRKAAQGLPPDRLQALLASCGLPEAGATRAG